MNNSEKILKLISNFIETGILTSQDAKKELINNLNHPKGYSGRDKDNIRYSRCDSYIDNLFTLKIKNISNKNISKIILPRLFDKSMNWRRSRDFTETLEGSSLQYLPEYITFIDSTKKEVEFIYNLVFHKPGYSWNHSGDNDEKFDEMNFAITNLSHSRAIIELTGENVKEVLKKGCPYDFNSLKKNNCLNSTFNGMSVTIDFLDDNPNKIRIFTLRSFGESLYYSVTDSSLEFGYKSF